MARNGFLIYHDDADILKWADDTTLSNIVRALVDYSENIPKSDEIHTLEGIAPMEQALFRSMCQKIKHGAYCVSQRPGLRSKTAGMRS